MLILDEFSEATPARRCTLWFWLYSGYIFDRSVRSPWEVDIFRNQVIDSVLLATAFNSENPIDSQKCGYWIQFILKWLDGEKLDTLFTFELLWENMCKSKSLSKQNHQTIQDLQQEIAHLRTVFAVKWCRNQDRKSPLQFYRVIKVKSNQLTLPNN